VSKDYQKKTAWTSTIEESAAPVAGLDVVSVVSETVMVTPRVPTPHGDVSPQAPEHGECQPSG
jgi:hypothetical protein